MRLTMITVIQSKRGNEIRSKKTTNSNLGLTRTDPEYMSKKDDELNEFIEEVTDGTYNMSFHEVILKFVNQITSCRIHQDFHYCK